MDIRENILFEDENLIAVYKPAGVPVQSKSITAMDLESEVKNYLSKEQKGQAYLGIIHRIDQPVEGIVLFAKSEKAAALLSKEISDGAVEKYYRAVVCGKPDSASGELVDYLVKDTKTNLSFISKKEDKKAKKSRLSFEVKETINRNGEEYSALEIRLFTGRHHQIRAQLSNMGCPIVGDRKYNHKEYGLKADFPALAAYRLKFENPLSGELMDIQIVSRGEVYNFFNF